MVEILFNFELTFRTFFVDTLVGGVMLIPGVVVHDFGVRLGDDWMKECIERLRKVLVMYDV